MESDVMEIERNGHVATVWLNRPEKLNAMSRSFWIDLPRALEELSQDSRMRAIVIAGRGRAFTVGIDIALLAEVAGQGQGSDATRKLARYAEVRRMQQTMTSIAECPKPVIAAIHGFCLGGGIDLITACDIRLASQDAVFSVRETKMGMVADVGTMQRLPRIVGAGAFAELVYTGRDIGAERALAIGLVNSISPDAESVVAAAQKMAAEIAANSPLAVQGAKRVLAAEADMPLDQALDHIALYNSAFIESHDLREAVTAFLEKRDPEFTGE